jgi:hypothetical protein
MEAEATAALGEVTLGELPLSVGGIATEGGSSSRDVAGSGSNAEDEDSDGLSAALASAPMAEELEAAELAAAAAEETKRKKKKRPKKKKTSAGVSAGGSAGEADAQLVTGPAGSTGPVATATATAAASPAASPGAAQVSADVLSAHSVLAEFVGRFAAATAGAAAAEESVSAAGVAANNGAARFRVVKYCKYAHLFPLEASGLLKTFELPLGSAADAQTRELADDTDGSLSACVAGLGVGDRVELEWLQIKLTLTPPLRPILPLLSLPLLLPTLEPAPTPPTPLPRPGPQVRVVLQCQKLVRLDAAAEAKFAARYPKPQLMIPKGKAGGSGGSSVGKARAVAAGGSTCPGAFAQGPCVCGQAHAQPAPQPQRALTAANSPVSDGSLGAELKKVERG